MRRAPRRHRRVRVEALDQQHLVRPLPVLEVPPVARVRLDRPRLVPVARVDDGRRDEVRVRDRGRVSYGQGVFEDGLDGAPELWVLRLVFRAHGWGLVIV